MANEIILGYGVRNTVIGQYDDNKFSINSLIDVLFRFRKKIGGEIT